MRDASGNVYRDKFATGNIVMLRCEKSHLIFRKQSNDNFIFITYCHELRYNHRDR